MKCAEHGYIEFAGGLEASFVGFVGFKSSGM